MGELPAAGAPRRLPKALVLALAITLLARALLPISAYLVRQDPAAFLVPDSYDYLALAESLATSGSYRFDGAPELRRVPGFPALVALGVRTGHPVAVTLALQLLLGAATVLLCYALARELAGARAGAAAALLFAAAAELWVWSSYLLSETVFVFLVAAMLWSALRYERSARPGFLLLAVALGCACAYVRLIGYALPFLIVFWFAPRWRSRHHLGRALVAVALAAALLGVWHLRNGLVAGYWGFSSQFERALYYLGGSAAGTGDNQASYLEARRHLEESLNGGEPQTPDDAASISKMRSRGLASIREKPVAFAASYGVGVAAVLGHPVSAYAFRLFESNPSPDRNGRSGLFELNRGRWRTAWRLLAARGPLFWLLAFLQTAQLAVYYTLGIVALRRAGANRAFALVALLALCLLLLSGGEHGNARYRAPLLPSICVLAGVGVARIAEDRRLPIEQATG